MSYILCCCKEAKAEIGPTGVRKTALFRLDLDPPALSPACAHPRHGFDQSKRCPLLTETCSHLFAKKRGRNIHSVHSREGVGFLIEEQEVGILGGFLLLALQPAVDETVHFEGFVRHVGAMYDVLGRLRKSNERSQDQRCTPIALTLKKRSVSPVVGAMHK